MKNTHNNLIFEEIYNGVKYKVDDIIEYSFFEGGIEARVKGVLENRHGHLSVHSIPLYVLIRQNHKRRVKIINTIQEHTKN